MVEYLKGVKMNSLIVMAIKDSTWPWHWRQEWITYVDGYGSETVQNTNKRTILDDPQHPGVGCPFTACEYRICGS